MRLSIPILFLTLVVSGLVAKAAPSNNYELNPIEMSPKDKNEPIYSSQRSEHPWSLRLGLLSGAFKETNQAEQLYFFGLAYDFQKESLNAWQMEVDGGLSNAIHNFVHVTMGKKFYFPLSLNTMPYYKLSVGDLIDSTEGLGSIFNLKKIQAIAAIGLDDLLEWNQHLQGELGVSYALIGPQVEVSLGFSF